jgi:very-short-patch-repair endonuclease
MTDGPRTHAYDGERTEAFSTAGFYVFRYALCRNVRDEFEGVSTVADLVDCPDCLVRMQ